MRKVWLCIFYALCIFTIVFSLFWMALPSLPFPADSGEETPASEPGLAAQGRKSSIAMTLVMVWMFAMLLLFITSPHMGMPMVNCTA